MKIDFFKIKAASPLKHSHPGFDSYVTSMENLVRETIPESVIEMHETSLFIPIDTSFEKLNQALPLVQLSDESDAPCTLSFTVLTREEHTHGVGLFLCEMVSQKLFPGKKMPITFLRSLSFKFIVKPKERYYIIEFFIEVESLKELRTIQKNFPRFEEEVRLTILGVERARKIVQAKGHTMEEKRMILSENIASLIKNPYNSDRKSFFTATQKLLLEAMYDNNPDKIPEHILPYIDAKPQAFDHLIFKEIENISILFHENFASRRSLAHLSKMISYLYLFRKILTNTTHAKPEERHLSIKLLSVRVDKVPTLALLIGVNFTQAYEILEERDIIQAVSSLVPSAKLVPGSNIINEQGKEGIRMLYIELQKEGKTPFSAEETKLLKKRLPKEVKKAIHSPLPQAPSIDEERVRGIMALTKELTSPHGPAQVIIQFHNETETDFHFSVILARLQKPHEPHLELHSTPPLTIRKQERKVAGILSQRYIKEIYLYEMIIQKEGRDLADCRSHIFSFIKSRVHNLHDFNGGMIARKYENLGAFKSLLEDAAHDSLVENYFYSISPPYLQSLTPPTVLKDHFELLLSGLDRNFILEETHILKEEVENHTLVYITTSNEEEYERIRESVAHFSGDIATSAIKVFDLYSFGFILPADASSPNLIEMIDGLVSLV